MWVAAAGVAAALLVATNVVPQLRDHNESPPDSAEHAMPIGGPAGGVEGAVPMSAPDNDPVTVLPALLDARARCLAARSVECLGAVDAGGSAALAEDTAAMASADAAAGALTAADLSAPPQLVQRMGDFAVVSVTTDSTTASVLMIRTEAGWRIRDVLSGAAG